MGVGCAWKGFKKIVCILQPPDRWVLSSAPHRLRGQLKWGEMSRLIFLYENPLVSHFVHFFPFLSFDCLFIRPCILLSWSSSSLSIAVLSSSWAVMGWCGCNCSSIVWLYCACWCWWAGCGLVGYAWAEGYIMGILDVPNAFYIARHLIETFDWPRPLVIP